MKLDEFWYIGCRSAQLRGAPLARRILGEHVVLFRDAAGAAAALLDRCAHRHMALSRGRVTPRGLACCYHGWTWGGDGTCTHIPADCAADGTHGIRIRSFPVVERQGFVWVWMGRREPAEQPIALPFHGEKRWSHWVMERVFEGDAFHCVENFLDVPHTATVHNKWFRKEASQDVRLAVTGGADWVQAEFIDETPFDTLLGRLLFPRGERMTHVDRFVLPYTTRVDYRFSERRHFVIMSQCTPETADRSRVFTYVAFRFDPVAPLVRVLFQPVTARILQQDVDIIREQTEDLRRFERRPFLFHRTDAIGKEIRRLLDGESLADLAPETRRIRV